jgi:hypothetical protein
MRALQPAQGLHLKKQIQRLMARQGAAPNTCSIVVLARGRVSWCWLVFALASLQLYHV